jgi:hypothetical protein
VADVDGKVTLGHTYYSSVKQGSMCDGCNYVELSCLVFLASASGVDSS